MTEESAASELPSYGARIAQLAGQSPDLEALVFVRIDGTTSSYRWAELDRRSSEIASWLAGLGLGIGDRLALSLRNSPELVLSALAAWKVGAVPVPIRWDVPEWELTRILEVVDAKVHLDTGSVADLAASAGRPTHSLPDVVSPQTHGICSSGSTGMPKVILIDRPAQFDVEAVLPFPSAWIDPPRPQVVLVPAPMYHSNGFLTLVSLLAGDRLVLMEKFDAALVVDLIEEQRVTTVTATTTMLQRIADLPGVDERDLSSLVWVLQGAAAAPPSLVGRWIDLIGAERLYFAYGMTEGLGLAAMRGDEWLVRPGSVGRGYRETEIRIVGDDGEPVPSGTIGEIYLRQTGGGLYRYLGGTPRLPTTEDGFASAGDLGWLDDDGFLFIADRRADLIISGGANVYPAEVESALIDHPGVADVVVIGLTDSEWGRRVHAIIEPADPSHPPTEDDVIAFAKERLARYKAPKTVEIVAAIPRSEATKVSRSGLIAEREPTS